MGELKIREQAVRQAQAKENERAQKRMEHQRKKDEHRIEKERHEALKRQQELEKQKAEQMAILAQIANEKALELEKKHKREIEALKAQYKLLQEQAKTSSANQNPKQVRNQEMPIEAKAENLTPLTAAEMIPLL